MIYAVKSIYFSLIFDDTVYSKSSSGEETVKILRSLGGGGRSVQRKSDQKSGKVFTSKDFMNFQIY